MVCGPKPNFSSRWLDQHHLRHHFEAIVVKAIENAGADVVDAALHGAIERRGVPIVIVLGTLAVHLRVGFAVEGFLEQHIGSGSRLLQLAIFVDCGGGDLHVDAAYFAFVLHRFIDGLHGFEDVLDGGLHRVFAHVDHQALVSQLLEGLYLLADLVHRQALANGVGAFVVTAVCAVVDAVVTQI